MVLVNILIFALLMFSLFLNYAIVRRIADYDAEFYLDKTDPDNMKPVLKFDLDEIEEKPFFIVKVLKDKEKNE